MSAGSRRSSKGPVTARSNIPLTRENLARLRLKAVRRGYWFRDLKREERKLLNLTIRVVEKVHSFLLAKIVSRIVSKLCEAMESRIFRLMRTQGRNMAENLSNIAHAWGSGLPKVGRMIGGFMQYLTVSNLLSCKT